ncbi:MAG: methyltransferase [Saprospiraceae bacterium]|nr:methyltransferase [Saprospiraceae bacterium]
MKDEELSIYDFGNFQIWQSDRLMKVSTDSLLLAGYCKNLSFTQVLDIGCGIGVITFILSSYEPTAQCIGVDVQSEAIQIAQKSKVLNSDITNIDFIHCDIQNYSSSKRFDLIVSNPPYYVNQLRAINILRDEFRHTDNNFVEKFANSCKNLSSDTGQIVIIIPLNMEALWSREMSQKGFILNELVLLKFQNNSDNLVVICKYSSTDLSFVRREWVYGESNNNISKI